MWFLTSLWNFITVRKNFVKSVVYNLFYSSITSLWKEARSCFFGYQWIEHFLNTLTSLRRQTFIFFLSFYFSVSIHSHRDSTVYNLDHFHLKIFTHKKLGKTYSFTLLLIPCIFEPLVWKFSLKQKTDIVARKETVSKQNCVISFCKMSYKNINLKVFHKQQ